MIDFLIKSTVSLIVLLVVYHLVLENEKIHQFNRFYLLFAVVFSLSIPFLTIEIIQEITTKASLQNLFVNENGIATSITESTNYWLIALYNIYGFVTSILLFRFIRNIFKLHLKAKSAVTIKHKSAQLALIGEKTLPYTFLNNIFVYETAYKNREIEDELYTHELIHVTQKHTLDILFIETLKVIFWFNPIFIFYKSAIQLNHEFLADEKVVQSYNNVSFYQNLLLSKANANPTYCLASNLNYSVTKKRLIMMTKTTSTASAILKKGLLVPVLIALVFTICTKVVAQETTKKQASTAKKSEGIFNKYYEKTTFKIKDESGKIVKDKKYDELTVLEQRAVPSIISKNKRLPTNEELIAELQKGAAAIIEVDVFSPENKKIKKADGEIYNTSEISERPDFPNGIEEFYKFVGLNFKAPENPKNLKGKIYITFIIEKDGSITNVRSIRDIGYGTGEEAIRVIKLSPKWIPGKVNNEPVRVMYSLPITVQSSN
ncbi:hypothetical protein RCH18_000651 [Flavobacterium sp. PL11]|uniref:M56 family metallopeptidase n=1 Tax=Flavobacterium sp. PL11 TaxID=3071717 RepID=UPI002DF9647B|nr:hypothetical protein [Flavobacterium sp. PL11]